MKSCRSVVAIAIPIACFACSHGDSSTGPNTHGVATIAVTSSASPSVFIGNIVTLTATAFNASGGIMPGETFTWTSSDTGVATVSAAGVVSGIAAGVTTISAAIGSVAGHTAVTVSASAAQLDCSTSTPLALGVGQVHMLAGVERSSLCIGGGAGSEYVLIPFNAVLDTTATFAEFTLNATNTSATQRPPNPQLVAPAAPRALNVVPRDRAFEQRLRESARKELGPMFPGARALSFNLSRSSSAAGHLSASIGLLSDTTVGTLIQLNTNALSACSSPQPHAARIVAVSHNAIVAVDTLAPAGGFTLTDYQNFAATFDTVVYPLDTLNFGAPYHLNGNNADGSSKILLFFSQIVNQLSPPGSGSYIGGFFYSRDLFPPSGNSPLGTCAGSNYGEMFYLPVVDSAKLYNSYFTDKAMMASQLFTTFAHEFQHLINAERHLYINTAAPDFEETWLDEDQSLIAQELLYFHVAGFAPRERLTQSAVTSGSNANGTRLNLFYAYAVEQLSDLLVYLESPETNSPYEDNDQVPTAGAGWTWLRYVLDNTTGAQTTYTRAIDNGVVLSFANIQNVFASTFPNIATSYQQWAIAQYVDGTGVTSNPIYMFPSWSYRDVLSFLNLGGPYPLAIHPLLPTTPVTLSLRPGSAGYIRFRVGSGLTAQIVPANEIPVSTAVTFALIRTF